MVNPLNQHNMGKINQLNHNEDISLNEASINDPDCHWKMDCHDWKIPTLTSSQSSFPQLQERSDIYLDVAAAPTYDVSIIDRFSTTLKENLFGNPHSFSSPSALFTTNMIEQVRHRVLKHFNVDSESYSVVFTSGATASLKLLAEQFQWPLNGTSKNTFFYSEFSHTSVVGMREIFKQKQVHISCFSFEKMEEYLKSLNSDTCELESESESLDTNVDVNLESNLTDNTVSLVSFPAQCNFSGLRFPSSWINQLQSKGHLVLVDAASYLSSSTLDLNCYPADFVVMSFYKIFGFPTGLGALLVKNKSQKWILDHELSSKTEETSTCFSYFGGGTVASVTIDTPDIFPISAKDPIRNICKYNLLNTNKNRHEKGWVKRRESLHSRLEHGTLPILEIVALNTAFDVYQEKYTNPDQGISSPWEHIELHTHQLAELCRSQLASLTHPTTRTPVCVLYPSANDPSHASLNKLKKGPIVSFNLLKEDQSCVGYSEVMKLAFVNRIHLRPGCFCNPGACQRFLKLSSTEIIENTEVHGHVCWDDHDLIKGKPTGAIRVSFGIHNTIKDINEFIRFIKKFFCEKAQTRQYQQNTNKDTLISHSNLSISLPPNLHITRMFIYPIKSCGGYEVESWPLGPTGFYFDRYWMIVDITTGKPLSQKRYPKMALIRPTCIEFDGHCCRMTLKIGDQGDVCIEEWVNTIFDFNDGTCASIEMCDGSKVLSRKTDYQRTIEKSDSFKNKSEVQSQLTSFFGFPCQLVSSKTDPDHSRMNFEKNARLSFANESQFLLVSQKSFDKVFELLLPDSKSFVGIECFRPNLIMDSGFINGIEDEDSDQLKPFQEDEWIGKELNVGGHAFQIQSQCQRCQMVCINQFTGERTREPLSTLAQHHKINGKIMFGVHVNQLKKGPSDDTVCLLRRGDSIQLRSE